MAAPAQQSMSNGKHGFAGKAADDTPAYQILQQHGLLDTRYRLDKSTQIESFPANATRSGNLSLQICCLPCWCCGLFKTFEVSSGQVRLVDDGRGNFSFHGNGVHRICDPFYKIGGARSYQEGVITHGDLCLAVVEQGKIGYVLEKGQPILLPPGLHQWRSTTMTFQRLYDLNNNVVSMGPLTLVTVDSGYSAVTEDNGQQKILEGGHTYLLTHRNWKFQKYITSKIQSSNLKRIEATSADNVLMAVDATVIWRISDVEAAALNAGETIRQDGSDTQAGDIGSIAKLTNDVLMQATASLAAFIGAVNYSDTFNVAAAVQTNDRVVPQVSGALVVGAPVAETAARRQTQSSPLFDLGRMQTCLEHANSVTSTYGVTILSINVVAAVPAQKELMVSLAQGAVAAAEAQKFEVVASGKAAAAKIEAKGTAEAEVLKARGDAEAERVRAEGHKAAADSMATSELATKLAMIDHTGLALKDNKAFFFDADPQSLGQLLTAAVSDPPRAGGNAPAPTQANRGGFFG